MKFRGLFLAFMLCFPFFTSVAQNKVQLSGYVRDDKTGEEIIGATIFIKELQTGAATDINGYYSISLPKSTYHVEYSFVGMKSVERQLDLQQNLVQNIKLTEIDQELEEVVVSAEAEDRNVSNIEMSVEKMPVEVIKKMPAFMGEVDVIKSLITLPGVTTVGEGASGFNVRGGNIDQNLVLLDGAPIYSSSHLFGFFSVFNPDVVSDIKLYKGGIPATFGGRVASVLDIQEKDGNSKSFSGSGGIGAVSSRLSLEGPLVKDKGSFIISGRRSYADLFLKLSNDEALKNSTAYFYDLNGKAAYQLNENNRLTFSGYYGRDVFRFKDQFGFDWGNTAARLKWNHTFHDNFFADFSAIYSQYDYALGVPSGENAFELNSQILNYNLKSDMTYFFRVGSKLDFGVSGLFYTVKPGEMIPGEENITISPFTIQSEYALEPAAYISHEYEFNDRWTVSYGLRYSMFLKFGKGTTYTYEDGLPRSSKSIQDTLDFGKGELMKTYGGLEPRLALKVGLDPNSSIKFSYNRMFQYLQLVSNTTSALPTDVWKLSNEYVKPLIGDQIALGYFRNFKENTYEFSAETYLKYMQNVMDYKNGAELLLNDNLDTELLEGIGRAYGLELMLKKTKGKFTGWLSYTLSRSERQVDGDNPEETINEGNWYLSNYDKMHDLTFVGAYQLNKRLSFSANFTYSSGRPITYPEGKYEYEGIVIPHYSLRNQNRVPDYHRLDLSATLESRDRPSRRWKGSWSFSLYNVYARRNTYSIFFQPQENDPAKTEAVRLSILGSLVPAVTYNFTF
ncbi:TonB-dependent receptor [Xanthovirga aplysinae]|uniref:TonB-dependent receptor n=1 Tax=Xanthovirga aplysinae TaxID=2529853 RepID=UPI0012BB6E51|nr:TonB-dependent receptor [Xanthovirga aplysinae]MTI30828.1 TonB-dependent receptor [Xanthovirga aplysinae]